MFGFECASESVSAWLNACARGVWIWSLQLDKASAFFHLKGEQTR